MAAHTLGLAQGAYSGASPPLERLVDALDTIADYLIQGASDEAAAAHVTDSELLR